MLLNYALPSSTCIDDRWTNGDPTEQNKRMEAPAHFFSATFDKVQVWIKAKQTTSRAKDSLAAQSESSHRQFNGRYRHCRATSTFFDMDIGVPKSLPKLFLSEAEKVRQNSKARSSAHPAARTC